MPLSIHGYFRRFRPKHFSKRLLESLSKFMLYRIPTFPSPFSLLISITPQFLNRGKSRYQGRFFLLLLLLLFSSFMKLIADQVHIRVPPSGPKATRCEYCQNIKKDREEVN